MSVQVRSIELYDDDEVLELHIESDETYLVNMTGEGHDISFRGQSIDNLLALRDFLTYALGDKP